MQRYDAIVAGTGGVGSAVLDHLARRGLRVLGLDRHPPGHAYGSSHGQTRIIRQAYFEHPDYVPLAVRSYDGWAELEARTGETLFRQTGLLQVGPSNGRVLAGIVKSAQQHGLDLLHLSDRDISERWPQLRVQFDEAGIFETRAGFLHVERCVLAHCQSAIAAGAALQTDEPIIDVQQAGSSHNNSGVLVRTGKETYQADHLVLALGAWAPDFLPQLAPRLEVRRKSLYWYRTDETSWEYQRDMPGFLIETPAGIFYGFPKIDDRGVKLAEHTGGAVVHDPSSLDRANDAHEQSRVDAFASQYLSSLTGRCAEHAVCMYTMTPDGHFVVGPSPNQPSVLIAAGLSGHGFKFAPVIGQALADLAVDGKTELPIGFLSADRPSLIG